MEVAPRDRACSSLRALLIVAGAALLLITATAHAQLMDPTRESMFGPPRGMGQSPGLGPTRPPGMKPPRDAKDRNKRAADDLDMSTEPLRPGEVNVVEVRIEGNEAFSKDEIRPNIRTRAGRPFRMSIIESDVRRLYRTGMFVTVEPFYEERPEGRVVIFRVAERPTLREVAFIRQEKVSAFESLFSSAKKEEKKLQEKARLKPGDPADPHAVEEARRSLEDYYRNEKGYAQARVSIAEGNKPTDRRAVFVIHEGPKEKIVWTKFIGNTIASDARLLTQVESKQGILWIFKGEFARDKLKADEEKLTAYYRSLGFFHAKVGHDVTYTRFPFPWSDPRAVVTFVIDEGPRWKVRDVSFVGNTKFATPELAEDLKLQKDEFFNQNKMLGDVRRIREQYGGVGHIFCDVKAEPRFLEEPGQLDLVYSITEGDVYRVGRINPKIAGDNPHTKVTTLLNPLSLVPGDIIDTREIRATETRYLASQVFNTDRQRGRMPKIVFNPADAKQLSDDEPKEQVARQPQTQPPGFRGQSPDTYVPSRPRPTRQPGYTAAPVQPRYAAERHVAPPRTDWVFFREPDFSLKPPGWSAPPPTLYGQWPHRQDGGTQ